MNNVAVLYARFKAFDKEFRDIWESYCLVEMLAQEGHRLLKEGKIPPLTMSTLFGGEKKLPTKDALGAIDRLRKKSEPRSILLEAVAHFEDYLGWITKAVLKDDPSLLKTDAAASEREEIKLISLILDSADKSEIMERIIEEKVRGIFYGSPVDFFVKSKSKLRFNKYFETMCQQQLEQYSEITARRNIIAHNSGKVDRKYLREVKNPVYKLGQTVPITNIYLQESIQLLHGLATKVTEIVSVRHYNVVPKGKLAERAKSSKLPSI
ncbi:hypothetical protein [Pseudomonas zeae]|uniref:RiboL-PSP-HEPN domain-containing protein n=1 Tax=Pseudomonas zeae TaxID=2745510 RepID=A0ABU5BKW3_9PSED|nr:hypothetical protein [Pseudomonas zeae]MDX9677003.1 hypothetical protein [Pseudomonas zeae]